MNVTDVPAQIVVELAEIETLAGKFGLTLIDIELVDAHCPAVGVKVYVVVAVLFNAGDQVPVMLLFDVVGSAFKVAPEQIAAACVNVGVVRLLTVATTGILGVEIFQL